MGFETPTPPEVEINKPAVDMEPILNRVAPIEGVFSPDEEVQKLWSIPHEQRREAVSVFKDKLARQREAWALCRTNIEDRIETNPDLPREEMVRVIGEFARHYGFTEDHTKVAESLIDDYIEMHKRVVEVREEFPDNIALINRLTGRKFSKFDAEDFKVSVGPMSIEISCSGFNAGRIYERSEDPVVGFRYGGFESQSRDKKPIYYLVVNNDYVSSDPAYHSSIVPHEREHQKNKILGPKLYGVSDVRSDVREQLNQGVLRFLRHQVGEKLLKFERNFENEVFRKYKSAKNPEEKAFLLTEYMRLKRETALNRAKGEIIAIRAEQDCQGDCQGDYIFFGQDGKSYDYLKYLRDWDKKKEHDLWPKIAQQVLVEEYNEILYNAIVAFDNLKDGGYSQREVIAMLSDKRLAEWPKTVKRLLEQKIK